MGRLALHVRQWLSRPAGIISGRRGRVFAPPLGQVDLGDLRRVLPLGEETEQESGQPVDRYYIDQFFRRRAPVLHGHVLEVSDDGSTIAAVGGRVATVTALTFADDAALLRYLAATREGTYETLILRQILHRVYDLAPLVRQVHRVLTPGGILLATAPGTCYAPGWDGAPASYWGFTSISLSQLVKENFPAHRVEIESWGNALVAVAHLHRVGLRYVSRRALDHRDEHYPLVLTLAAEKGPH